MKHRVRKNRQFVQRSALGVGTILVLALGWLWIHSGVAYAQLSDLKLVPKPETYTELYFDNSLTLPSVWTARPVHLTFHVHNVEGKTMIYPYEVLVLSSPEPAVVEAQGSLTLANDLYQDVPVTVTLPASTSATEVMVVLPNQQQQIDFWVSGEQIK